MINNIFPSKRYINSLDFTIYVHQKYSKNNFDIDEICPECSGQMTLKIISNENSFKWVCQKCSFFSEFRLDRSKIKLPHIRSADSKAYYGFCSCNYDRNGHILDKTPPELLKKFISIFFWLVNIDENLYSETKEKDVIMLSNHENIYEYVYRTYKFPKFYDHGAWGTHHMDPIFLFNRIDKSKYILPSKEEMEKEKNELWSEIKDFLVISLKHQSQKVESLINKMEECLEIDLREVIFKIHSLTPKNEN